MCTDSRVVPGSVDCGRCGNPIVLPPAEDSPKFDESLELEIRLITRRSFSHYLATPLVRPFMARRHVLP